MLVKSGPRGVGAKGGKILSGVKSVDELRQRFRSDWRNDDGVLLEYFEGCVENWKLYSGPRLPHQIAKLNAIYKQATRGDSPWKQTETSTAAEIAAESGWARLKGTPKNVAMRRYITYLAEINPLIIDVMPSEKPPVGFPTLEGKTICAKCNTKVGCARPVMNKQHVELAQIISQDESLHDAVHLRAFIESCIDSHECMWGLHRPITREQAKPFIEWFYRNSNQGFSPYNLKPLYDLVKDILKYHYEIAWDMQQHKNEYSVEDFNAQIIRVYGLRDYYVELSGERFVFEVPCNRNNEICNARRKGDGGVNHCHPVELDLPTVNYATYDDLARLRQQCIDIGISPSVGVEPDIDKRCQIYRERIFHHFERLKEAKAAATRNEIRRVQRVEQTRAIAKLSASISQRQIWEATHTRDLHRLKNIINKGAELNTETPRNLTILLCLVLNKAPDEMLAAAVQRGADINMVNKDGFTALAMACKTQNTSAVHMLMKLGANVNTRCGPKEQGVIHICGEFGLEEQLKIILDHVKDGAGDSLKVERFLNMKDKEGMTALMVAAETRNLLMCKLLIGVGADPGIRNARGKTAESLARDAGWTEIAEWLGSKSDGGVRGAGTIHDVAIEKKMRFGIMEMRDLIDEFSRVFLSMLCNRSVGNMISGSPVDYPDVIEKQLIENPEMLRTASEIVYNKIYTPCSKHRLEVMKRDLLEHNITTSDLSQRHFELISPTEISPSAIPWDEDIVRLRKLSSQMADLVARCECYPNFESTKHRRWTALMCAALVCDFGSMRKLLREGAGVNYSNSYGITAFMQVSQLNLIEPMIFLLGEGADIERRDLMGFSAIAYASKYPLPKALQIPPEQFIFSDPYLFFEKRISAERVIKFVKAQGVEPIEMMINENLWNTSEEKYQQWLHSKAFLESRGLSKIQSSSDFDKTVEHALYWLSNQRDKSFLSLRRATGADAYDSINNDSDSENTEERKEYEQILHQQRLEKEKQAELDKLRCPICTLITPCAHFLKPELLKKMMENGYKPRPQSSIRHGAGLSQVRKAQAAQRVLREAQLDDRSTDRITPKLRLYQQRIHQLRKMKLLEASAPLKITQGAPELSTKSQDTSLIQDDSVSMSNPGVVSIAKSNIPDETRMPTLGVSLDASKEPFSSENKEKSNTESDVSSEAMPIPTQKEAKDAIMTEWSQKLDDDGNVVMINNVTGEAWTMYWTTWENGDKYPYYYNAETEVTQWEPPGSLALLQEIQKKEAEVEEKQEKNLAAQENSPNSSPQAAPKPAEVVPKSLLKRGDSSRRITGGVRFPDKVEASVYIIDPESTKSFRLDPPDAPAQRNSEDSSIDAVKPNDANGQRLELYNEIGQGGGDKGGDAAATRMENKKSDEIRASTASESATSPQLIGEQLVQPFRSEAPMQPLPPNERTVAMFSKTSRIGSALIDGLLPHDIRNSITSTNKARAGASQDWRGGRPHSPSHDSAAQDLGAHPIVIPGWIFSGITMRMNRGSPSAIRRDELNKPPEAPLPSVNVSFHAWGQLVEHIKTIYESWAPHIYLEPVSPRRCQACNMLAPPLGPNVGLELAYAAELRIFCASCTLRCAIYQKLKHSVPWTQKILMQEKWTQITQVDTRDGSENNQIVSVFDHGKPNSDIGGVKTLSNDHSTQSNRAFAESCPSESIQTIGPDVEFEAIKPAVKALRESELIPFLLAKGQYEEAERVIRTAIHNMDRSCSPNFSEILRLYALQADMYMMMGLGALAISIHLDIVQLMTTAQRSEEDAYYAELVRLFSCIRKAGFEKSILSKVAKGVLAMLQRVSVLLNSDVPIKRRMEAMNQESQTACNVDNAVFALIDRETNMKHSGTRFAALRSSVYGITAFVKAIVSSNGFGIVGRLKFVQFCFFIDGEVGGNALISVGESHFGAAALFLYTICRARQACHKDTLFFLLQDVMHKYLASHCPFASLPIPGLNKAIDVCRPIIADHFNRRGKSPKIKHFDRVVAVVVAYLLPVFSRFVHRRENWIVTEGALNVVPELYYVCCVVIQSHWRRFMVRHKIFPRKRIFSAGAADDATDLTRQGSSESFGSLSSSRLKLLGTRTMSASERSLGTDTELSDAMYDVLVESNYSDEETW